MRGWQRFGAKLKKKDFSRVLQGGRQKKNKRKNLQQKQTRKLQDMTGQNEGTELKCVGQMEENMINMERWDKDALTQLPTKQRALQEKVFDLVGRSFFLFYFFFHF